MGDKDEGVSELVSFILILAVIAAGAAIFAAAVLPEIEKANQHEAETAISDAFFELKTRIDHLWLFKTKTSSLLLPDAGSVLSGQSQKSPVITFTHTDGQTTASLLTISYVNAGTHMTYEGGAVFSGSQMLLSPSMSETHAILITTNTEFGTLSANRPMLLQLSGSSPVTYTNVSALQITGSTNSAYWQEALFGVTALTLVDVALTAEAVS